MQIINFYEKPSPHIIIDEFLPPKLSKNCLEEAIKLEPFYKDANVMGDEEFKEHQDCKECAEKYKFNRDSIRENDVVYLDDTFAKKRESSIILKSLHNAITSEDFLNLIDKQSFWHILKHTNSTETVLSRYGKCDFYGWHNDTIPDNPTGRLVTLCYYINEEPEQFEGGDLIIAGNTIHDTIKLKPKHNRAVIFQSDSTKHAVDTVKLTSDDFKGGRFSVNFWIGFTNNFKYR